MKSLAISLASRVSGSLQESFLGSRERDTSIGMGGGSYTDRIQNLSNKISAQITDLDNRLDKILEKHEKDFLTAYRFHMLKVQKELVSLKSKANENELKSQQESRINDLEKSTQVYREQCMKLRNKCDAQEKSLTTLKNEIDELEDDRKFLDYEIRDSRLQNKMLKITLSKQHNECEQINNLNQTAKEEITHLHNQSVLNKSIMTQKEQQTLQNQSNIQNQEGLDMFQSKQKPVGFQSQQYQSYMDKQTTDITTARLNNEGMNQKINLVTPSKLTDKLSKVHGTVKENSIEETLNLNHQQDQQTNQASGGNNLYATFMKDSQNQQTQKQQNQQPVQTAGSQVYNKTSSFQNQYLDAEETQIEQQTESNQLGLRMLSSQDDNDINLPNGTMQELKSTQGFQQTQQQSATTDQSIFNGNDNNNKNADHSTNLKYMSKISQGYKEGRGPGDLKKTFMYNAKFTQQLFDTLELTNKDEKTTSLMVEQLFEEDQNRRQDMVEHLRQKLALQRQLNSQKQIQVQIQKQMLSQKKESEILVQTFKNCINAVILDKKDRLGINENSNGNNNTSLNGSQVGFGQNITNNAMAGGQIYKDNLYPSDKKRIIELFVENDNTLSHLLEFISSKLIDQENENNQDGQSKNSFSKQFGKNYQGASRGLSRDDLINRQNVANSQLSGTGEIQNDGSQINKQSSTINHYNLHIPIKSLSSEINSSNYYSNINPQGKLQHFISGVGVESNQFQNQFLSSNSKNLLVDPLFSNSQNNSTMRGEPSSFIRGLRENQQESNSNKQTTNINSKATLRMAGQQSISKTSHISLGRAAVQNTQSSQRTLSEVPQ